jgi:SAM-dependent methyltransferase
MFRFNYYRFVRAGLEEDDPRKYRDGFDRTGIELYLHFAPPEQLFKNKNVLDIGCGFGGKTARLLGYRPRAVLGIDVSKSSIKLAKELINSRNRKKLNFKVIDLLVLSSKQGFDTVVSFTVFEHIDRQFLLPYLNKISELLTPNGKAIIIFNHFCDRFGSHLQQHIYFPWPQLIFEEKTLFQYWNDRHAHSTKLKESRYPKSYKHGVGVHNSDCFMNVNKVSIDDFLEMINQSKLYCTQTYYYSKSEVLRVFPLLSNKYLLGSCAYMLQKRSA